MPKHPAFRIGLVVLGLALLWAISQATVSAYLQADAQAQQQRYAEGLGPFIWPMRSSSELVGGSVHGSNQWQLTAGGLQLRVSAEGATVALHLHGRLLSTAQLDTLHLQLHANSKVSLDVLLSSADGESLTSQANLSIPEGGGQFAIALPTAMVSNQLRLYFRADSTASLRLQTVWLSAERCAAPPCQPPTQTLLPAARVETLLLARDAGLAEAPQSLWLSAFPNLPGWPALIRTPPLSDIGLPLLAISLSGWALWLRRSCSRPVVELIAVLGPIVLALLLGWPNVDRAVVHWFLPLMSFSAAIVFGDCETRRFSWLGDFLAWRAYLRPTLAMTTVLIVVALAQNSLRWPAIDDVLRYVLWAAVQQLLLIRFVAPRVVMITQSRTELALTCGFLFALLHLPNFSLALLTAMAGAWWAVIGHHHRALLPALTSHAVLGLLVVAALPPNWLRSAEVGIRFVFAP
jgi:hypothetical protein